MSPDLQTAYQAQAWACLFHGPRAAAATVQRLGPLSGMAFWDSVRIYTEAHRETIYAPCVDPEKAHARTMALLDAAGLEPAPWPHMIEHYKREGLILPDDIWYSGGNP